MNSKKIIATALSIAVVFSAAGIYWYKARIAADTKEMLVGTRMQMVDTGGALVKNQVPLELKFNGTVRECKVTKILFAKISKCSNKNRDFRRIAITSTEGTYSVGTESYRPLTKNEAKVVVESYAQEKIGRELNTDEKARIARLTDQASGLATPTNEAVEGIAKNVFNDYTPPANDQTVTTSSSQPFSDALTAATTLGATYAAGSAVAAGVKAGTAVNSAQAGLSAAKSSLGSTLKSAGSWLKANPAAIAAIVVLATISTKKTERDFNLETAVVRPAGDIYKGEPVTLKYGAATYQKEGKLAVALNDFDQAFYGAAADQLYGQFIGSNSTISDIAKTNYKNLLATNVLYLTYARLHGYSEANVNSDIAASIKNLVDGGVINSNNVVTGPNVIKNGDFESGNTNWTQRHDGTGGSESVVSTGCRSGKCVEMIPGGDFQATFQEMGNLAPGKYQFSAYYKTVGNSSPNLSGVSINLRDTVSNISYNLGMNGSVEWKKILTEFNVPSAENAFFVYLYSDLSGKGPATVYFDDVQLNKM